MVKNILDEAYEGAKQVISMASMKHGLFASAGKSGYDAIWARDSMISMVGASLVDDDKFGKKFKETFKRSLITLGENQSDDGQIPNAVDKFSERKGHVDFASIDSSLWFVIGHYVYKKRYGDKGFFKKHENKIKKAVTWLDYQDVGEDGMLGQLPTTDWQDAFPHKYGHTINTQALYYGVLKLVGKRKELKELDKVVNKNEGKGLWGKEFYVAYRWKNHNKYKEIGDWFDSLGNLLAIVFELADKKKANIILDYIHKKKIDKPYPIKAIWPVIKKKSKYWQDYFQDCDARSPNQYLNGGIWTYIGGFYVLSLIKMKRFNEAEKTLEKLAEANVMGNFPEWIHPKTKKSFGKLQCWNAGMYILAYESFKKKKVLL